MTGQLLSSCPSPSRLLISSWRENDKGKRSENEDPCVYKLLDLADNSISAFFSEMAEDQRREKHRALFRSYPSLPQQQQERADVIQVSLMDELMHLRSKKRGDTLFGLASLQEKLLEKLIASIDEARSSGVDIPEAKEDEAVRYALVVLILDPAQSMPHKKQIVWKDGTSGETVMHYKQAIAASMLHIGVNVSHVSWFVIPWPS